MGHLARPTAKKVPLGTGNSGTDPAVSATPSQHFKDAKETRPTATSAPVTSDGIPPMETKKLSPLVTKGRVGGELGFTQPLLGESWWHGLFWACSQ